LFYSQPANNISHFQKKTSRRSGGSPTGRFPANKLKSSEGDRFIGISREEIAQYVGTATESLIRTISDFRAEKLIEIREGKITIPEDSKLAKLRY
jgi:CRP-like cAMP-binding protein